MLDHKTDADWETFGAQDPYWAVLTNDRFKKSNMDEQALRQFFTSGQEYVDWAFSVIHEHIQEGFSPRRALDFGCGVGRLLAPIASKAEQAVGIDISESMLREAAKVCEARKLKNVTLLRGDDALSKLSGTFDFINSFIVLQHIPCVRGVAIFRRLVDLLAEDGVGAIHVTFSKGTGVSKLPESAYAWPPLDGLRTHFKGCFSAIRRRLLASARKLKSKRPDTGAPVMQMNPYNLNALFAILQQAGAKHLHIALTNHGGTLGTVIFFRKSSTRPYVPSCLHE
ncbi:MAG: hypothetical protein JWM16_753 [Verrucomicrobiales bacterium]|nr:hypothetical protein [Verrucomicrobiales bacterium]